MTRVAPAVFGVLVVATFGAFFLAQRLKNAPKIIARLGVESYFSPNGDGRFDRANLSFKLRETDEPTVTVVDAAGDALRQLTGGRTLLAGRLMRLKWDGRSDVGARVPDGRYHYRITLQRQGRSILLAQSVRLDVTPPRPQVASIGPRRNAGPELLPEPGGGGAVVHLENVGRKPVIRLFKTSPGPVRLVRREPLDDGAKLWRWDGLTQGGRPVSPGTYLAAIESRDQAGNRGLSPALDRRGLPAAPYGVTLAGHGGITVRYLGVQPPSEPTVAGAEAPFGVDARQEPWTWSVRRVGSNEATPSRRKTTARLRLHAPGKESGVYLLQIRTATRTTTVPFPVQSRERHAVLVVLPVMTWQGRNAIDDDGDGLPNLLDRGVGAKLDRVYAGDGLPVGFAQREAPLLTWLDRGHHRYDITTDVALAAGHGPRLEGHEGVILPSDVRWLPRALQQRLRRFVRGGGALASFGVDALRRQVTVSSAQRLVGPTPPATTDLFGAQLAPPRTLPAPTPLVEATDDIQFFAGTTGAFGPFSSLQELQSPGSDAKPLATAQTQDPQTGRSVISATRVGRGLVLRFPLPELPSLLASGGDPQTTALMDRAWTLLSH
jgi:N,N-dimethylformamidase beta subunit-like protein